MSRYRKIQVRTWSDEKFSKLSSIPPCGKGLWFFLLTGPHTGQVPGLFRAGRAAMAEELEWEVEDFDKAFQEVSDQGMAKADFKARLVWLPKAIQHNRPESPNVVKSWRSAIDLLPECDLKDEAIQHIAAFLEEMGQPYLHAFTGDASTSPGMPTESQSRKPSSKAIGNQEQEQEQESTPADAGGSADKPAPPGRPDCPHQEIIGLYHELLPACREVVTWPEHRQKLLRTRWNEDPTRQSLDWWRRFFAYVAKSKFLNGRGPCAPGRDPFVADLEWLVRPMNFVKVIEGKYHNEEDIQ